MHKVWNWAKYKRFIFYIVPFELIKIQTFSAPQNDVMHLIFVKDRLKCLYPNWFKSNNIFMIVSQVTNFVYHSLVSEAS